MNWNFKNEFNENLLTFKQASEILNLRYGRNTFYQNLKKWGCLESNNKPTVIMLESKLMVYLEKHIRIGGSKVQISFIPLFTEKGIDFIDSKIEEKGLAES